MSERDAELQTVETVALKVACDFPDLDLTAQIHHAMRLTRGTLAPDDVRAALLRLRT